MDERDWTDDAELLARAMEAGEDSRRSGWQRPEGNSVVIDGDYNATAVLNVIRAAAWDEAFNAGIGYATDLESVDRGQLDHAERPVNPYRLFNGEEEQ